MEQTSDTCDFTVLFSDIDDEKEFSSQKLLLAHYTSISNLESILKNRQIWFSNPLYLNDHEELRFGMNEGLELLMYDDSIQEQLLKATRSEANREKLQMHFRSLFDDFEKKHALDTFVLSFCGHDVDNNDGKLSMWRGYGSNGNGACIVFNGHAIGEVEDSPLVFGKVHYATKEQRLQKLRHYLGQVCEQLAQSRDVEDHLEMGAWYLFQRFKIFALFSKHHGFREEEEWRLVYLPERDEQGVLNRFIDYHLTQTGLQPKLKLPIQPIEGVTPTDLSLENLVNRIILGPSTSTLLAQRMFQRMLQKMQLEVLGPVVKASSIPFRQL